MKNLTSYAGPLILIQDVSTCDWSVQINVTAISHFYLLFQLQGGYLSEGPILRSSVAQTQGANVRIHSRAVLVHLCHLVAGEAAVPHPLP